MESILEKYGWIAMLTYVLVKDVVPWILNKYFPERMKVEQAKRNADALLLKNELEEKEHRRAMEERSVAAMEKIGDGLIVVTERMEKIDQKLSQHDAFTVEAVTAMRETVAKNRRDTKEKMKPVRKVANK